MKNIKFINRRKKRKINLGDFQRYSNLKREINKNTIKPIIQNIFLNISSSSIHEKFI